MERKKILAISGSTRSESVNLHILNAISDMYSEEADWTIYQAIDTLPHFNPDLDRAPLPETVSTFRNLIAASDAVLICTPEYVFSLPGSLKNAIEWLVSTTLFTDKPAALITASSSGVKAMEALNLIMQTVGVSLGNTGTLLIQAPKTKITREGIITDPITLSQIRALAEDLLKRISGSNQ
ncbi:MAG: NAD(P)H-dependent oxidoreductase [Bacteroidota bacterium]|nr:NAD(P)H-dependent oxidoreductase [Bacteroidota bacterium]